MDVEQAMKWASLRTSSQGCDDQDYAAFTTLAAEVRRLQPDAEKYRAMVNTRVRHMLTTEKDDIDTVRAACDAINDTMIVLTADAEAAAEAARERGGT